MKPYGPTTKELKAARRKARLDAFYAEPKEADTPTDTEMLDWLLAAISGRNISHAALFNWPPQNRNDIVAAMRTETGKEGE